MLVRSAPNRLRVPSFSCAGPRRISWSVPLLPALTRVPRGSAAATFGAGDPLPVYVGALPPDPS
jgi:hypothetical protein